MGKKTYVADQKILCPRDDDFIFIKLFIDIINWNT